jgi:hypothetical protein
VVCLTGLQYAALACDDAVQADPQVSVRTRLVLAARRLSRPITAGLEERVGELASEVAGLRRSVEQSPASEATMTSAIEAALVLSRSAKVLESLMIALAPPQPGEVVFSVRSCDATRAEEALGDWQILSREASGGTTVLRGRLP